MEFEIWNFPHVDTLISIENPEALSEPLPSETPEMPPEPSPQEQAERLHAEALSEHLNIAREISQTLSKQLNDINATFLTNITQLIKKITEKVILKEIHLDNERLSDMVKQALLQIQQDHEPCTVYLSESQYAYFSSHASMPPEVQIKLDPNLTESDFRIKTAFSELESILQNRLNEIFGL